MEANLRGEGSVMGGGMMQGISTPHCTAVCTMKGGEGVVDCRDGMHSFG